MTVDTRISALGVEIRLVVNRHSLLPAARELLDDELSQLDSACSRFRPDSELVRLQATPDTDVRITGLLAEALRVAVSAADATDGAVDPTLGGPICDLGYDRDFALLPVDGSPVTVVRAVTPGSWRQIRLDAGGSTARVPSGVRIDLGATAKAFGADRAANRIMDELGIGVLVAFGADIAVAGPAPDGGWPVRVLDARGTLDPVPGTRAQTLALHAGGLATSSMLMHRWSRGGEMLHHLLDPLTGRPVGGPWQTITVAADTCLAANIASTAAMVAGEGALEQLTARGLPSRLVAMDGSVTRLGGWPEAA
jgi:thiamine biosynthesis lipoprotein ApbE